MGGSKIHRKKVSAPPNRRCTTIGPHPFLADTTPFSGLGGVNGIG